MIRPLIVTETRYLRVVFRVLSLCTSRAVNRIRVSRPCGTNVVDPCYHSASSVLLTRGDGVVRKVLEVVTHRDERVLSVPTSLRNSLRRGEWWTILAFVASLHDVETHQRHDKMEFT